jgi:hypothetical protein
MEGRGRASDNIFIERSGVRSSTKRSISKTVVSTKTLQEINPENPDRPVNWEVAIPCHCT